MKRVALLLLILAACAEEQLTSEQQEYKSLCDQDNNPWMLMNEMKDGKIIGPSCYGCMPNERNHICTREEYKTFA
ncbi:hypothetical protein C4580_01350 [Candidatus Woesearchaeota archaeon]|nr:MAG: hypothetical protein C4580_01350 [Candidatus Woesearchaeota archaeon]